MLHTLRVTRVRVEKDGVVWEGMELRLLHADAEFAILIASSEALIINLVPVAGDVLHAYRQFSLVAALSLVTERLASDAMVMAYPLPAGATLADPNVDTRAVRDAIGNAEVDRILALPLPDDIVVLLS